MAKTLDKRKYYNYLKSDKWKSKRKQVKELCNYKCAKCGVRTFKGDVHHKTYARLYREKLSDLVYLCRKCHINSHKVKKPLTK